ncbi:FIST signal transduction protein [Thermoanaerobacterium sp. DL9XJH110]|uniref:FIST signal transduction protein n=1 Tax=Thermoanaerobacterium sp. DL9XJH110 TaxID=3386643 RepID=UPI003BB6A93C
MKVGVGFSCKDDPILAGKLAVRQALDLTGEPAITFLFCTANYDQETVYKSVKEVIGKSKLIGGSTAGVITAQGVFEKGVGICAIEKSGIEAQTLVISPEEIKSLPECSLMEKKLRDFTVDSGTLFIFTDCSCDNMPLILRRIYNILGLDFTYIGGGTGDSLSFSGAHQFTERGVEVGSIAVALLRGIKFTVGIGHGWMPWGEPMIVTRSSGKIVYEIDGFPAFDVYSKNLALKDKNEFAFFGMKYPFGMPCAGTNFLIRDPIGVNEDGSIRLVSEIPQNSAISLMKGNLESFINTAEEVAKRVILSQPKPRAIFLFDCVSRYLLMKKDFEKELKTVMSIVGGDTPVLGMLTFGEIGAYSSVPLFHNKTMVVAAGW